LDKECCWSSYHEFIEKNKIIDIDFVLGLFNNDRKKAIDSFKTFHEVTNNDKCLDIKENRRLTDNEAIKIIKRICNVPHCTEVQILEKDKRNRYLKLGWTAKRGLVDMCRDAWRFEKNYEE